jgi:hypothetical protein
VPDDLPIRKVLSQLGLTKSLQRIKFGGVVGKQTLLGIAGMTVLGVIAWKTNANGIIIALLAVFLVLAVAIMNFLYADRHPAEAMLEGLEMVALHHQMLAAKTLEPPSNSPVIPNPEGNPPQLQPSAEPD